MNPRTDYALLAARTLTPRRADAAPARKLARGKSDPADAWNALSSLLTPLTAGEAQRAFARVPFANPATGEEPRSPDIDKEQMPTPPTQKGCQAFATHAEAVVAAEELARETLRRLAPFGVSMRERILWSVVPSFPGAPQGGEYVFNAVQSALLPPDLEKATNITLRAAFRNAADRYGGELAVRCTSLVEGKACEPYIDAVGFAAVWDRAIAVELEVPPYEFAPGEVIPAAGKRFADLENPYEPMIDLMLQGYWLSGATEDSVILVATEPERRGRR